MSFAVEHTAGGGGTLESVCRGMCAVQPWKMYVSIAGSNLSWHNAFLSALSVDC